MTMPKIRHRDRPVAAAAPIIRFRRPHDIAPSPILTPFGDEAAADKPAKKRKPNKGSFKKGVSGNLAGRPKGAKSARAIMRKHLSTKIVVRTKDGDRKVPVHEALFMKEVQLASGGEWRARQLMHAIVQQLFPEPLQAAASEQQDYGVAGDAILQLFTEEILADAQAKPKQKDNRK